MNPFVQLLKWDWLQLVRNQVVTISLVVTAIYTSIFIAIQAVPNVDKWLILIIFNDPAIIGFIFAGVMVLLEKNQNTLQALAVTPMQTRHYILSKTLLLSSISLACCLLMVVGSGLGFYWITFCLASLLCTSLFCWIGFVSLSGVNDVNTFVLKAAGIFVVLGLPFLGYFGLMNKMWFVLFPTQPAIDLLSASFQGAPTNKILAAFVLLVFWNVIFYFWALKSFNRTLGKSE